MGNKKISFYVELPAEDVSTEKWIKVFQEFEAELEIRTNAVYNRNTTIITAQCPLEKATRFVELCPRYFGGAARIFIQLSSVMNTLWNYFLSIRVMIEEESDYLEIDSSGKVRFPNFSGFYAIENIITCSLNQWVIIDWENHMQYDNHRKVRTILGEINGKTFADDIRTIKIWTL